MRVLLTTDTVGGVWTYALDLARGLRTLGAEVVLATMGGRLTSDRRADAAAAELAALHESAFAVEWMPEPWADVDSAGRWLLELARRESVDIVHSNSFAHGALPWERPVVVAGHSCVVSWWRAVEGAEPPADWDEYRRRVRAGLQAADAVVAPSAAMLGELEQTYGVTGLVIHNGSGVPENDSGKLPFILTAGRLWDLAKGFDVLDAAAAQLEWRVLAAGDGPAPRHVRALGRLSRGELDRVRERATVFAAPARYEPFGLGILEAARAGCALVLSDIASLRELWSDAAVFTPVGDSAALHAALRRVLRQPAEREQLSRAARMRARRFSVERMARDYLQLYGRLLGSAADGDQRVAA